MPIFTSQSVQQLHAQKQFVYEGSLNITLTPDSQSSEIQKYTGDISIRMTTGGADYSFHRLYEYYPERESCPQVQFDTSKSGVEFVSIEYDGDVDFKIKPTATYNRVWSYSGDINLELTPEASINKDLTGTVGGVDLNFIPQSNYILQDAEYAYAGDVGLDIVLSSDTDVDFIYDGSIDLSFDLSSDYLHAEEFIYSGDIDLKFAPHAEYSEVNEYSGDIGLVLTPSSVYSKSEQTFTYEGNIDLTLNLSSESSIEYPYEGSVKFRLIPNSATGHEEGYIGYQEIDIELLSEYVYTPVKIYNGEVTIECIPNSTYSFTDVNTYVYEGDIDLSLTPEADIDTDLVYTGDLDVKLDLQSIANQEKVYNGNILLDIAPNSDYNHQEQTFEYEGSIALNLELSSEIDVGFIYIGGVKVLFDPDSPPEFRADSQIQDIVELEYERKEIELRI